MFLFITSLRGQTQEGRSAGIRVAVPSFVHSFATAFRAELAAARRRLSFVYGVRSWLVTFDLPVATGVKPRRARFRETFAHAKKKKKRTEIVAPRARVRFAHRDGKRADNEHAGGPRILCVPHGA